MEESGGAAEPFDRCDAAAIAALRIVVNSGLIPHARQGGSGVDAFAVAGSKLDGTGFENEQIRQTQVAGTDCGAGDGLDVFSDVSDAEPANGLVGRVLCDEPIPRFCGFG